MSRDDRPHAPPVSGQFQKGQSGNPTGRPRKSPSASKTTGSAFDIVLAKVLTVTQGGVPCAVSVDEALQLRTYQAALAGDRSARREILRMIAKRDAAIVAKNRVPQSKVLIRCESEDPRNADAALLMLGIVDYDPERAGRSKPEQQLLLEPWAVQAALNRRRGVPALTERQIAEIRHRTRDADSLSWPKDRRRRPALPEFFEEVNNMVFKL